MVSVPDTVRRGFLCRLPTDSGGPLVACGNEPTEVQNGVQKLFLFFLKLFFRKCLTLAKAARMRLGK
jgi:hypothetical protein